ncbi:Dimethylallyltranstransferase [Dactylellina cionopaga]|nr:Dimethylallyltranstransferase [Dactylellina cionopaga]
MGRFFQIRDDYQNLGSEDYSRAKGSLSDLDEGKYSFMLIHALTTTKDSQLKALLRLRPQQKDQKLTPEQKNLIMKIFTKTKSMEYTLNVLQELQVTIEKTLEGIEEGLPGKEKNWIVRAIMARLRVGRNYSFVPSALV